MPRPRTLAACLLLAFILPAVTRTRCQYHTKLSGASPDIFFSYLKFLSYPLAFYFRRFSLLFSSTVIHHHVAEHIVLEPELASQRPEPASIISTKLQVEEPGPPRGADCQAEARVRGAVQGVSQASLARGAEADQALQHRGL